MTQKRGAHTVRVHWSVELEALLSIMATPRRELELVQVRSSANSVSNWGEVN